MNQIPQAQLEQKQLERLAAMSQIYSNAKGILAVQTVLSVPLVLVWSILAAVSPSLSAYTAYWGITVTFLDILIFAPWQQSLQKKAALIQEIFDCDVLQMDWREVKGRRPNTEEIVRAASRFKRQDPNYTRIKNWYPVSVNQLPIYLARLVCQRSNCWWDAELRRRYAFWVIAVVVTITVLVFLVGLIGGFTLQKFFLVVLAPLTPTIVLGVRQYLEHHEAAATLDRLKDKIEDLWNQAMQKTLTPQEITRESRNLQDEIYNNRRKSPLIFNWIYRLLRRDQEEQMNRGAEALVEEALRNP